MSRVVHFEIHATEPQALMAFYAALFGWTFEKWGEVDYWAISSGPPGAPGIDGGLLLRRGPRAAVGQPVNAFVCTVEVASLDESFARAQELGAGPAVPKMPIPGVGWLAYVQDPDGNILGLMQPDPSAK